jgi:hypothetical protein
LPVVLGIALFSAAPVSAAAARPGDRGEVLGRATRSAAPTSPAALAAVPTGFTDTAVWSGLTLPTAIAFAPGGKVFVGEKGGIVKVFDSLSDSSPTQVVDLHPQVQDYWDRGLLGLAVDPGFGSTGRNFIYVLYTHDHNPEGSPATWGDNCPTPPGPNNDGCTVTGNLSRIPVDPASGTATGAEQRADPLEERSGVPQVLDEVAGDNRVEAGRLEGQLHRLDVAHVDGLAEAARLLRRALQLHVEGQLDRVAGLRLAARHVRAHRPPERVDPNLAEPVPSAQVRVVRSLDARLADAIARAAAAGGPPPQDLQPAPTPEAAWGVRR